MFKPARYIPWLAFTMLVVCAPSLAQKNKPVRLDRKQVKELEALGKQWAQTRPPTRFDEWDTQAWDEVLALATQLPAPPPGHLDPMVDALWAGSRKGLPRVRGELPTPYGSATWIERPPSKRPSSKARFGAPLMIALHGGGEGAGDASAAAGNWRSKEHLAYYPQAIRLVHDAWNTVHGEKFVLSLIDHAKLHQDVDPDRVYVVGFSMGSTGAWHLIGRNPDLYAGAIPAHGVFMAAPRAQLATKEEVQSMQHGLLPNVHGLPVYFSTGSADMNCRPGTFLYAWDRIQSLQASDPEGYDKIRFTYREGLAHSFAAGEPEAGMKHVFGHTRNPWPDKIVWEYAANPYPHPVASDLTTRSQTHWYYWLHCSAPRDNMRVTATRAGNRFDLKLSGVEASAFSVYLREEMIDADEPVSVFVNGKEVHHRRPEPSFQVVLETLDARVDRRLVFDRKIELGSESR